MFSNFIIKKSNARNKYRANLGDPSPRVDTPFELPALKNGRRGRMRASDGFRASNRFLESPDPSISEDELPMIYARSKTEDKVKKRPVLRSRPKKTERTEKRLSSMIQLNFVVGGTQFNLNVSKSSNYKQLVYGSTALSVEKTVKRVKGRNIVLRRKLGSEDQNSIGGAYRVETMQEMPNLSSRPGSLSSRTDFSSDQEIQKLAEEEEEKTSEKVDSGRVHLDGHQFLKKLKKKSKEAKKRKIKKNRKNSILTKKSKARAASSTLNHP